VTGNLEKLDEWSSDLDYRLVRARENKAS